MASLCFDIGGTNIKYGVVSDGNMLMRGKVYTPITDCKNSIPAKVVSISKSIIKDSGELIDGIGISSAGQIDHVSGRVLFATKNLPGYTGTPFKDIVQSTFKLPCEVDNDVNAAAIGEQAFGAAKGENNFLLINIGTGIGGAIMLENRLVRGIMGSAGEIGHMIIQQGGLPCTCGMYGCFEQYASTGALLRDYFRLTKLMIDGEELLDRVNQKEHFAVMVYEKFLDNLATGLAGLVHIFDPGLIIIGGGISQIGKPLVSDIQSRLKRIIMPSFQAHTVLKTSKLVNDAPLIGMAVNLQQLKEKNLL